MTMTQLSRPNAYMDTVTVGDGVTAFRALLADTDNLLAEAVHESSEAHLAHLAELAESRIAALLDVRRLIVKHAAAVGVVLE